MRACAPGASCCACRPVPSSCWRRPRPCAGTRGWTGRSTRSGSAPERTANCACRCAGAGATSRPSAGRAPRRARASCPSPTRRSGSSTSTCRGPTTTPSCARAWPTCSSAMSGRPSKKRCDGVLVEREHLDVIIAEQKLSQSRLVDPSQRIPSGHLIGHNRVVSGTLTVTGATATLTVTVTNTATGLQRSVTRSGASGLGIFDLEKAVVEDVAKAICDPPARYVGPVSGSIPASAGSATGTFAWKGDMTLALDHVGPAPAGSPDGEYAFYRPAAGTIHLTLDLVDGHCAGHGETDLSVDPAAGDDSSVQVGVAQPTYTLYAAFGASPGIAFAWTGGTDADPCANDGTRPFAAGLPALATGTRQAASSTLKGSTTDVFPGLMGSVHRAWSLVPQG